MIFLLASLLLTQTWEWHESPGATSYRVYWSASGKAWCYSNGLEFPASVCVAGTCQGDISLPSYSVFIAVTALNSNGESATEHGAVIACLSAEAPTTQSLTPLAVTRHLDSDGLVCLMVSGIAHGVVSVQHRTVPDGAGGTNTIPSGAEMYCIPGWTPWAGSPFVEVRQCYPTTEAQKAQGVYADCEVTWYREKLCCGPGTGGCDTNIHHVCQGNEP